MNAAINFGKKQCSGSTIFSFARQRGFISLSQPAKLGEGIYRSKSAKTSAHNALRSFSTEEKTVTKRAPSAENERLSLVDGELSKELKQLSDDILNLNSVDMTLLLEIVQAKLGMSPEVMENLTSGSGIGGFSGGGGGAAAAAAAAPVVAAEPVKEKDAFDIKLTVVDPKSKIKIIKEVRALTGLGLKEAKDLVEKAPCVIKQGVKKEEVEAIKKILTDAGATIEII